MLLLRTTDQSADPKLAILLFTMAKDDLVRTGNKDAIKKIQALDFVIGELSTEILEHTKAFPC